MRPRNILFELKSLNQLIKREVDIRVKEEIPEGATGPQGMILDYLYRHMEDEIFQKDIAEEFSIRNSSVTSIISTLENNGYLTRESVSTDARLKKIVITEKGIDNVMKTRDIFESIDKELEDSLDPDELACFYSICEKLQKKRNEWRKK